MKLLVKWTLLIHRYLGFLLSLLFVIWFLSGFVMMYVGFPTMKHHQRLQKLPVIDLSQCRLSPPEALQKAGIADTLRTFRLGMLLNRPVYRFITLKNEHRVVFADNGEVYAGADTAQAARIATAFVKGTSRPQAVETLTEIDQWMAAHRSQGYLPNVHRLEMDDKAGTYVYVSVASGEVVQMLDASQRFWAWLGPIPHWIYPTVLIRNRPVWNQVVVWSSGIGTLMCVAGIVMGFVRYKRRRADSWAFSPYKKKWFRWHHYTGFVFGIFVFTWVLSGLFSMNPIDFGPSIDKRLEEMQYWSGGPLNPALVKLRPEKAAQLLQPELAVKEVHLIQLFGKPYYLAYQDDHHTRLLAADQEESKPLEALSPDLFIAPIQTLNPGYKIIESNVLTDYDDYYYSKKRERRLPVLRIKLDTPEKTWYYIDLKTGQIVLKHERGSRLERWLYHGLHSLDFRFLLYKRPLWDIVVGTLMLGGTLVSLTGLVLTWKWLRRKFRRKSKPKRYKRPVRLGI
ncbi:PepSY domain-containing protein [Tellurirhabdus bombi]|uniref:PepSY domain-containing protein n=1 Tax=Tellurirhabdus bombi TaxID=2907205 RepID=UPI001F404A9E|nr:PepSY domain-containing protein [Tellurirhabdus bombi]